MTREQIIRDLLETTLRWKARTLPERRARSVVKHVALISSVSQKAAIEVLCDVVTNGSNPLRFDGKHYISGII